MCPYMPYMVNTSTTQPHMPSYALHGPTHQPTSLICHYMPYMVQHINQPSYALICLIWSTTSTNQPHMPSYALHGPTHQPTFF